MYRNTFTDYDINVHIYWENQVNRSVFYVRNVVEFCSKRKQFLICWHLTLYSIISSYMLCSLSSVLVTWQGWFTEDIKALVQAWMKGKTPASLRIHSSSPTLLPKCVPFHACLNHTLGLQHIWILERCDVIGIHTYLRTRAITFLHAILVNTEIFLSLSMYTRDLTQIHL